MKKFICKFCGKEFESSAKLGGHIPHCKLNPNYNKNLEKCKNNISTTYKYINYNKKPKCKKYNDNIEYKCIYCGKICIGKNSLKQHEIRCKENPNRIESNFVKYNKERESIWNKGLTKETDERVRKYSETNSKKYKDGTNKVWSDGLTKYTDERIKKSSKKIQNTILNKIQNDDWHNSHDLSFYYKNCKFDSNWEVSFAKFLDNKNIKWIRNNTFYSNYIFNNSEHKYFPDFYLPNFDLYIEIKGYTTDIDICKWEQFKNKIDIYDSKDLVDLGILDLNSIDKRNFIPEKFRIKYLDLTKI